MGGTIWLTSDTHFGHTNIIHYAARPFASIEEHDEALIANWNEVVGETDTVYHLGDFCFSHGNRHSGYFLSRLKGRVVLILGNHDTDALRHREKFAAVHEGGQYELRHNHEKFMLNHYPMLAWNKSHHGRIHFFGHVHSRGGYVFLGDGSWSPLMQACNSWDVGADNNRFRPISLEDARAKARRVQDGLLAHEGSHGELPDRVERRR